MVAISNWVWWHLFQTNGHSFWKSKTPSICTHKCFCINVFCCLHFFIQFTYLPAIRNVLPSNFFVRFAFFIYLSLLIERSKEEKEIRNQLLIHLQLLSTLAALRKKTLSDGINKSWIDLPYFHNLFTRIIYYLQTFNKISLEKMGRKKCRKKIIKHSSI